MILKICTSSWNNASRDKRELSVYREQGFEVAVLAKGLSEDKGRIDHVSDYIVYRYSTRPIKHIPKSINRLFAIVVWAKYVGVVLKPDIISGHDYTGLLIGWLSNIFRRDKARLIYDSHEFEIGRNANRSRLEIEFLKMLEGFLIRRSVFTITVNDSIADLLQNEYKLKKRPFVLRSTPNKWRVDQKKCFDKRQELLSQLTEKKDFIIMYHGAMMPGRGIELLLKISSMKKDMNIVLLGDGAEEYLQKLKKIAEEYNVSSRVLFHSAVSIENLWKYVGAVDVGMITIPAVAESYYYMLPNKFFENIQSETPVIVSNFPEIDRLTKQYGVGLTCNPESYEEIIRCIEKMQFDKEFYNKCKKSVITAKNDLCWEKEKQYLEKAIKSLL